MSANVLYDVLHDSKYRKAWDPNVIDCFEICRVACNSDIGYYSSKNFFLYKSIIKKNRSGHSIRPHDFDPETWVLFMDLHNAT